MPEIVERDGKYCLEGYGDADACFDSEDEAKVARAKLTSGESKEADVPQFTNPPNWMPDVDTSNFGKAHEQEEQARFEGIWNKVKARLGWKSDSDEATGFKVAGNRYLAVWSNNFEDRDGEIFTEKAIDEYITRVDMGTVPPPELWVCHIPGTRIGQADMVGRHGHFVFSLGTFDNTPHAQAAKGYYARHGSKKRFSHGFTYPVDKHDGKHFHSFNTFENTFLPTGMEANLFTSLEGVKAAMREITEAKKAEMVAAFGKEEAERILSSLDAKGKALEDLGVAYKDYAGEDLQADANKQATDNADRAFKELIPDLMEGSAEAVTAALEAVKLVKAQKVETDALRGDVASLKALIEQRPRASQSQQTVIDTSDESSHISKALKDAIKEQNTERDEFWGLDVVKTP